MSEAGRAAQHGDAGQVHFPRLQDNRLVERQTPKFVVFAEKDSKQNGIAR